MCSSLLRRLYTSYEHLGWLLLTKGTVRIFNQNRTTNNTAASSQESTKNIYFQFSYISLKGQIILKKFFKLILLLFSSGCLFVTFSTFCLQTFRKKAEFIFIVHVFFPSNEFSMDFVVGFDDAAQLQWQLHQRRRHRQQQGDDDVND